MAVAVAAAVIAAGIVVPLCIAATAPRTKNLLPAGAFIVLGCLVVSTVVGAYYGRSKTAMTLGVFFGWIGAFVGVSIIDFLESLRSGRDGPLSFTRETVFVIGLVLASFFGAIQFALGAVIARAFYSAHGPRSWRGDLPKPRPVQVEVVCFNCGYALVGLPNATPCPECGAPRLVEPSYPHRPAFPRPTERELPG